MPLLNRETLLSYQAKDGLAVGPLVDNPERVLQFGEGNFLRAFVDWMINALNVQGQFNGSVVVVQPITQGLITQLNAQDGLYTLLLRGMQDGQVIDQREIITAISRGINPYSDWSAFLATAENPAMRFIVSNTTEAGIAFVAESQPIDNCPTSFPAKVTAWLYARYQYFHGSVDAGMVIIPCELIDRNGDTLRKCVAQYVQTWQLDDCFATWVQTSCVFLNTLVDRIVTGYPREEVAALTTELGYEDQLLDTGEIFHLWVIEGDSRLRKELPFHTIGLNVLWTDKLEPYRTRKVRILNGAHTMTVLAAFLAGKESVRESVEDPVINAYMRKGLFTEIIPLLDLPENEKTQFAESVLERFCNPFIKHQLLSIALNSVSKFAVRVLPSLQVYIEKQAKVPEVLSFSLAALLAFYHSAYEEDGVIYGLRDGHSYPIRDDAAILKVFSAAWAACTVEGDLHALCQTILSQITWWGSDLTRLPGLLDTVVIHLNMIQSLGMMHALHNIVDMEDVA